MNLTRKSFVECMACFAAGRAFAAPHGMFGGGSPELVFAALSDVHIVHPKGNVITGIKTFEGALRWYGARGVDAVVVAGDLADSGIDDELEMLGAAWRRAFPDDKAPDGRHVEKIFITGNHDYEAWKYGGCSSRIVHPNQEDLERHILSPRYPEAWQSAFGERYEPIYMKDVRGYRFIGSHWTDGGESQWGDRLRALVAERGDELKGGKPFFYVQHPHPRGTICGTKDSPDDGETVKILSGYPNAVAFSGHSHWSITDERSIWQGGFTSVNLGSLRRPGFCRTVNAQCGYENWRTPGTSGKNKSPEASAVNGAKAMPMHPGAYNSHHGSLVKVYSDRIVIERLEFTDMAHVAEDWVIPIAHSAQRPYDYGVRSAHAVAPQFAQGAKLAVERVEAKNRAGKTVAAVKLTFPAANAERGTRPYDYRIEIVGRDGKSEFRSVLAQGVELGVGSVAAKGPSECTLALETLPAGPIVFKVSPGECFGKLGLPIAARFEG